MRLACGAASRILDTLSGLVKPGITTGEVDAACADLIAQEGCKSAFLGYRLADRVFPGHCCISINEEVVHGIGGPRRIQYGDVVKIDVGVIRDGWVGDNASTIPVGAISPDWMRLLEVTEEALYLGISQAREGRRLGDVSSAIEERVLASGFSVVRDFVGHGVGRKLHEEPQVPNYGKRNTGPVLKAGWTIAIEPMVNAGVPGVRILNDGWTVVTCDGRPSAHFEHTVLITKDEPEILTWREKTLSKSKAK